MVELGRIYYENCQRTMARMPDNFIQLTVTSPPYDKQRTYRGFVFRFKAIAQALSHKTAPGGVIVWVVASEVVKGSETLTPFKQAIYFVEHCGLRLHDTMIYQKLNFSHPEKVRYHSVFEYVFVFSKGKPATFNPIIDRPNKTAGTIGNLGINTFTLRDGSKSQRTKKLTLEHGMRHNVWLGRTRGQEEMCKELKHPAMMPRWLARDHIITWSNEGDVVYDPMAGSGTVIQEAAKLNRRWLGSEISQDYAPLHSSIIL